MRPLVSICIPAYRNPEMLKRCIQSVLVQTYTHYELIITDDSPDNCIELLLNELLNDRPYQYYRNTPALGSPENWNKAIRLSKGEYIKLLHHDDWFPEPDSLEQFITAATESGASFLFCNSNVVSPAPNGSYIHAANSRQLKRLRTEPDFLFFRNIIGAPSATLYKRDDSLQYDPAFTWLVDVAFYIRYLIKHQSVYHINATLMNTFNGAEGQITQSVANDARIVLGEHLLLFDALYPDVIHSEKSVLYFEELFARFGITTFHALNDLVPVPPTLIPFLQKVFKEQTKNAWLKKITKRLLTSRYNKQFFKIERF